MIAINAKLKLIVLFVVLALLPVAPAFADEQVVVQEQGKVKIVVFKLNDKNYYVQDAEGNVTATQMDVAPYVESGRTFVPVRFLGNALGLHNDSDIKWDPSAGTVTLKGRKTLVLTLGSKIMKSDSDSITMDVAPGVKPPGRTMLPARYVAEGLGFQVDWDPVKQMVVCYPQGEPKPDLTKINDYLENYGPVTVGKGNTQLTIYKKPGFLVPLPGIPYASVECGYFYEPYDGCVEIRIPSNNLYYTRQQTEEYCKEVVRAITEKYGEKYGKEIEKHLMAAIPPARDETDLGYYCEYIPCPEFGVVFEVYGSTTYGLNVIITKT